MSEHCTAELCGRGWLGGARSGTKWAGLNMRFKVWSIWTLPWPPRSIVFPFFPQMRDGYIHLHTEKIRLLRFARDQKRDKKVLTVMRNQRLGSTIPLKCIQNNDDSKPLSFALTAVRILNKLSKINISLSSLIWIHFLKNIKVYG